jgi:uncharacterized membrane protein YccC
MRLVLSLGMATAMKHLWPGHHLYWVALTVVLLIERPIEAVPIKTIQRALGTVLGVLVAALLLADAPPAWTVVAGIGLLGAARTYLRPRNYLAYTAAMTPLIVVILDGGQPVETGVLVDRVVSTLIAAVLVVTVNLAFGALTKSGDRTAQTSPADPASPGNQP